MRWVYYKNELVTAETVHLSLSNRAFRYADGVFESIRLYDQAPVFWSTHYERLKQSLSVYDININITQEELKKAIVATVTKNDIGLHGKLRITVFRDGAGKYSPETNAGIIVIEARPSGKALYPMPVVSKKAVLYDEWKLPSHALGNHKGLNKSLHVLAAIKAKKQDCEEALLVNDQGLVGEAISSSVFCYRDNALITPPLSDGGLNGVVRKIIIENQNELGLSVIERSIHPNDLNLCSEVWTTNANSGVSAISHLGDLTFHEAVANEVQIKLEALAVNSCLDFQETQT